MVILILAVLGMYMAQVFVPASFRTALAPDATTATADHLRGKDNAPELSVMGARAQRAVDNLKETLPVFLTVAVLLQIQGTTGGLAQSGAIVFLIARVLYMPAYMLAITGLRTTVWSIGWVGIFLMVLALF
ncbi:MAG: putative MAPEG superfamily protein [Myxococcota bacterium]|jgi:uncharacterized MAPEG superfamily protein